MTTGRHISSGGSIFRFSSDDFPAEEVIGRWGRFSSEHLFSFDVRFLDDEDLRTEATVVRVGRLLVIRISASSHILERSRALIRQSPSDGLVLCFALRGQPFGHQGGRTWVSRPGQITVLELDRPLITGFPQSFQCVLLGLSRAVFQQTTGLTDPSALTGVDLSHHVYAVKLRKHLIDVAEGTVPAREEPLLHLLGAMTASRKANSEGYLAAARDYAVAHLSDPQLSSPRIAAAIGISPRHLSRVFADSGASVPQYLRERRLDLAYQLLGEADPATSVADIARTCGFTSASHFSRVFAERFGQSPSEVLRAARLHRGPRDGPL